MVQESLQTAANSSIAPIILAVATLVTAMAGGFVLVLNALRTKRIEEKVDESARTQNGMVATQGEIHKAVNSNMADAIKKIDDGTVKFIAATAEIAALKAAAVDEIAKQMAELNERLEERDRARYPIRRRKRS